MVTPPTEAASASAFAPGPGPEIAPETGLGAPRGIDLVPAAVTGGGAAVAGALLGLGDGLPEALAVRVDAGACLGASLALAALSATVLLPLRSLGRGPLRFGRGLAVGLAGASAVGVAVLPLAVATFALYGAAAPDALPIVGLLAVCAALGAIATAGGLTAPSTPPVERAPPPGRSDVDGARSVDDDRDEDRDAAGDPRGSDLPARLPALLAVLVFLATAPVAELLSARRDLEPTPDPAGATGGSPVAAAFAAADRIAAIRPVRGGEPDPPELPVAAGARIVRVARPPGGLFRPGRPVAIVVAVEAPSVEGRGLLVRSANAEMGAPLAPGRAGRLVATVPAVFDEGGLAATIAILTDADASGRGDGRRNSGARLPWPAERPALTAVAPGVVAIGWGGDDARRDAARIAPPTVPTRTAEITPAELLRWPTLTAETFDVIVVGKTAGAGVSTERVAAAAVALASSGGLVLARDAGLAERIARAAGLAAGAPAAPAIAVVGSGGVASIAPDADVEALARLVRGRGAARRRREGLRARLAEEATATALVPVAPAALRARLGRVVAITQAALAALMLLLGRRARAGRAAPAPIAAAALAIALAATAPVLLSWPGGRLVASVATVIHGRAGADRARADEAIAFGTFGTSTEGGAVAIDGPPPWPSATGRARRRVPRSELAGGPGRPASRLTVSVHPRRVETVLRSGAATAGLRVDVDEAGLTLRNESGVALDGVLIATPGGAIPIGVLAVGGEARVAATAERVSFAAYRARIDAVARRRLGLLRGWLEGEDLAERWVVVGFATNVGAASPVRAGASPIDGGPLAFLVLVPR